MDKALRRSGVRIRSASSGHTELQLVISEVGGIPSAGRRFTGAQQAAADDLLRWSLLQEDRAIRDAASQVHELSEMWTDVQRQFVESFKEYRRQFELILEGEKQLDVTRQKLAGAESRERKIRKDLEKAARKSSALEIADIESRLKTAVDGRELARVEVLECHKENEAVKLIRVKQNLLNMSEAYLELAHKCAHLFQAQKEIAEALPDVHDSQLHNVKYTGAVAVRRAVETARMRVQRYRRRRRNSAPALGETVAASREALAARDDDDDDDRYDDDDADDVVAVGRTPSSAPPPYNPFYDGVPPYYRSMSSLSTSSHRRSSAPLDHAR